MYYDHLWSYCGSINIVTVHWDAEMTWNDSIVKSTIIPSTCRWYLQGQISESLEEWQAMKLHQKHDTQKPGSIGMIARHPLASAPRWPGRHLPVSLLQTWRHRPSWRGTSEMAWAQLSKDVKDPVAFLSDQRSSATADICRYIHHCFYSICKHNFIHGIQYHVLYYAMLIWRCSHVLRALQQMLTYNIL